MMDGVLRFLNGDYGSVIRILRNDMEEAAAAMRYERAARIRDKIRDVEGMMERQIALQTDRSALLIDYLRERERRATPTPTKRFLWMQSSPTSTD